MPRMDDSRKAGPAGGDEFREQCLKEATHQSPIRSLARLDVEMLRALIESGHFADPSKLPESKRSVFSSHQLISGILNMYSRRKPFPPQMIHNLIEEKPCLAGYLTALPVLLEQQQKFVAVVDKKAIAASKVSEKDLKAQVKKLTKGKSLDAFENSAVFPVLQTDLIIYFNFYIDRLFQGEGN